MLIALYFLSLFVALIVLAIMFWPESMIPANRWKMLNPVLAFKALKQGWKADHWDIFPRT